MAEGVLFLFSFRADGWVGGWRRTPPPSLSSKRDLQHAYREQRGGGSDGSEERNFVKYNGNPMEFQKIVIELEGNQWHSRKFSIKTRFRWVSDCWQTPPLR